MSSFYDSWAPLTWLVAVRGASRTHPYLARAFGGMYDKTVTDRHKALHELHSRPHALLSPSESARPTD